MSKYQQGKIYKICSKQTDLIYIGSTTRTLEVRFSKHYYDYKTKLNIISSFEILQYEDSYIELIENWPCNSKEELLKREGHHIRNNNCVNKRIEGRTKQEYRHENIEKVAEINKNYYEQNKEKISEKKKHYREKNKDTITGKKKEWYENNKEKILEQRKQYRDNNKEKISEKSKELYECECNTILTISVKARHLKSKKHQAYLAEKNQDV